MFPVLLPQNWTSGVAECCITLLSLFYVVAMMLLDILVQTDLLYQLMWFSGISMVCQRFQIWLHVFFGFCIFVFSDIKIKLEREDISVYFLKNPLRDNGRNNIFHLNQCMKAVFPWQTVPLAAKVNMSLYYPILFIIHLSSVY